MFVHRWAPVGTEPHAVVHVSHGLAEHAGRYARLAERLNTAGYVVYAHDHRGHGRTAGTVAARGVFAARGGWARVVADCAAVNVRIHAAHPSLPVILLGHSMGSFVAQHYVCVYPETIAGLVLSGSSCGPSAPERVRLARNECRRIGPRAPSTVLTSASFGDFNAAFAPTRTDFDWLSRDPAEVDAYRADPWCGFPVSAQLWLDLLEGLDAIADAANVARIPERFPVYVFSGAQDPVHEQMRGLDRLLEGYRRAGLRDVTTRLYAGGRHEMLHETNREEVMDDLVHWLDGRTRT